MSPRAMNVFYKHKVLRLAARAAMALIIVALFQAFYFLMVLNMESTAAEPDAVVIFGGTTRRVEAGYATANAVNAPFILLSPATEAGRRKYDAKYGLQPGINHLAEPRARTTFENAFHVSRIIKQQGWQSVILVTSDYHMPRSLGLLRLLLIGDGVSIHPYSVSGKSLGKPPWEYRKIMARVMYNEMIKYWGSLGECAAVLIYGDISEPAISKSRFVSFMRHSLLLDGGAEW